MAERPPEQQIRERAELAIARFDTNGVESLGERELARDVLRLLEDNERLVAERDEAVERYAVVRRAYGLEAQARGAAEVERDRAVREACPDCGIPLRWCRAVTSNPDHCWRWDYEQFEDSKMRETALREALAEARPYLAWIERDPDQDAEDQIMAASIRGHIDEALAAAAGRTPGDAEAGRAE